MAVTKQYKEKLRRMAMMAVNSARARNMRKTSRKNPDGSESSHIMTTADNMAYPRLFPNKDGSWKELSGDEAYNEAKRRGEIFHFDSPEEAERFSWKKYK